MNSEPRKGRWPQHEGRVEHNLGPKPQIVAAGPVEKNRTRLDLNCVAVPAENSSKRNTSGYLHLPYESFPTGIF